MKVAILDDYQNVVKDLPSYNLLQSHDVTIYTDMPRSTEELIERLIDQDAVVLIRERTVIDHALLSRLPKLKLISQTGKISNHLDLHVCTAKNVAVAEGRGSPVAPSELCWSLIMAASRQLLPYASHLQQSQWQSSGGLGLGRTLSGLTLGIWGYGKIGKKIAQYAKIFDMTVIVWGSESSREKAIEDGFTVAESKAQFFSVSDILSLHLRLNEITAGSVTYDDLQLMKQDALLVNISRAELIETSALVYSLKNGRPGYAAVDVYESEPVGPDTQPLIAMPNVLCTPHLGYVEKNSYELYFKIAFENLNSFFANQPINIANPQIL